MSEFFPPKQLPSRAIRSHVQENTQSVGIILCGMAECALGPSGQHERVTVHMEGCGLCGLLNRKSRLFHEMVWTCSGLVEFPHIMGGNNPFFGGCFYKHIAGMVSKRHMMHT